MKLKRFGLIILVASVWFGCKKDKGISELIPLDVAVKKIWVATPDIIGGATRSLNFAQSGNKVCFILPELKYWDMLVLELE